MKQFNLDEYLRLKGEGKEPRIVTREGKNARILCTDYSNGAYPIIALYEWNERELCCTYTIDGTFFGSGKESNHDLFFADLDDEPKYRPFKDAEDLLRNQMDSWIKTLPPLPPGWVYDFTPGEPKYNPETNAWETTMEAKPRQM